MRVMKLFTSTVWGSPLQQALYDAKLVAGLSEDEHCDLWTAAQALNNLVEAIEGYLDDERKVHND